MQYLHFNKGHISCCYCNFPLGLSIQKKTLVGLFSPLWRGFSSLQPYQRGFTGNIFFEMLYASSGEVFLIEMQCFPTFIVSNEREKKLIHVLSMLTNTLFYFIVNMHFVILLVGDFIIYFKI